MTFASWTLDDLSMTAELEIGLEIEALEEKGNLKGGMYHMKYKAEDLV